MIIRGEKIILRAISLKDTDLLLNLINDPETEKMLGGFSYPVSREEQERWISNQFGRNDVFRGIVATVDDSDRGLGTVILSDIDSRNGVAQIHIKMDQEIGRGKGYGTDAVRAVVNYAFNEMRLNCIYADILEYNIPSQRLFEKCGFHKDGVLRSRVYKNGQYINLISYSICAGDNE